MRVIKLIIFLLKYKLPGHAPAQDLSAFTRNLAFLHFVPFKEIILLTFL